MTRIIWISLIALSVVFAVIIVQTPRRLPVDVATAKRREIVAYIEEQAQTRLPEIHKITMPLEGRVLPIQLREGDTVKTGQIVARLDTADLDTDLAEATNTVETIGKSLEALANAIEQAKLTLTADQAKVEYTERLFRRLSQLSEERVTAETDKEKAELDMIESRIDFRKDQLDEINYNLARIAIQLYHQTQIEKQKQAERDRARAEIRSPVSGVVLSRIVSNERVLAAGETLLEIGSLEQLEMEADVLTQEVVRVQVGDAVEIEGPAVGSKPVSGKVKRIYPRGFTKRSSLGVEQQRTKVIMTFDPGILDQLRKDGRSLGVDYRVRVKIQTDKKTNVIVVPRSALFRSAKGGWQTFVIQDGRATRTGIEIGLSNDFEVEIVSGVREGDNVIVAPESSLEDGQLVEST